MMDFAELVQHENAHSGLAFRAHAYDKGEHDQLIRDLLGLANAAVSGPRLLVLGVDVRPDGRFMTGVGEDDVRSLETLLPRIAARLVEPALKLELSKVAIDDKSVAVVAMHGCDDPPYLLSQDISSSMHAGRGWIRRGTQLHPLVRSDLQRMFESRNTGTDRVADLAIGFPGKIPAEEISLPALPLDAMPSRVAAERLRRILEGKSRARDVLGRTETQFNRLLHAQVFGSDHAFEEHSDDSLIKELEHVGESHAVADAHYELEQRTHRLQLEIRNNGEIDVDRATLQLTIMRLPGVGVSERLYTAVEDPTGAVAAGDGYPLVDVSPRKFVVQAEVGRIPAGRSRGAFREPLRLWLREAAVGKTLLIDYRLHCRDLAGPLAGSLRVHIDAAPAAANTQVRDDAQRAARTA